MKMLVVIAVVSLMHAKAFADIVEWRDADGVRHFTNVAEDVPAQFRDETKVVARERGGVVESQSLATDAPPRQAQVVYDPAHLARLYEEGVESGRRQAQLQARESRPVQVIAPVTIANVPVVPPYTPYLPPPCAEPYLSAGFDHGRGRYQTMRLSNQTCSWQRPYWPVGVFDTRLQPLRHRSPRRR